MPTAVIVDAVRTPGGKRGGKLRNWHPVDLAAEALKAIAERNNLDPALVDDVIMGCVSQVGAQAFNVGRSAVLAAGWPESVPATTIDRQCGSSQQALHFAAQGVMAGAYDIVIAAGVEVMSTVAMGSSIGKDSGFPFGATVFARYEDKGLSLIHISEPTRLGMISSVRLPSSSLTRMGMISFSKRPSAVACAARRWLSALKASRSVRLMSHWSAIISAPMPWPLRPPLSS